MSRCKESTLVNIAYGNRVMSTKVAAALSPEAAPMRRLKDDAKERNMLVDATQGRKSRSIINNDSGHFMLSAVQIEVITQRFTVGEGI